MRLFSSANKWGALYKLLTAIIFVAQLSVAHAQTSDSAEAPSPLTVVTLHLTTLKTLDECELFFGRFSADCKTQLIDEEDEWDDGTKTDWVREIAAAWFDFDQDGTEDLIYMLLGSGCGGHNCPTQLSIMRNGKSFTSSVAAASGDQLDVVRDPLSERTGIRFDEANYIFWLDELFRNNVNHRKIPYPMPPYKKHGKAAP